MKYLLFTLMVTLSLACNAQTLEDNAKQKIETLEKLIKQAEKRILMF